MVLEHFQIFASLYLILMIELFVSDQLTDSCLRKTWKSFEHTRKLKEFAKPLKLRKNKVGTNYNYIEIFKKVVNKK